MNLISPLGQRIFVGKAISFTLDDANLNLFLLFQIPGVCTTKKIYSNWNNINSILPNGRFFCASDNFSPQTRKRMFLIQTFQWWNCQGPPICSFPGDIATSGMLSQISWKALPSSHHLIIVKALDFFFYTQVAKFTCK